MASDEELLAELGTAIDAIESRYMTTGQFSMASKLLKSRRTGS